MVASGLVATEDQVQAKSFFAFIDIIMQYITFKQLPGNLVIPLSVPTLRIIPFVSMMMASLVCPYVCFILQSPNT